ncbi:DUF2249 domain-containing protein [Pseudactinotalea sp. HY158]|uniref:DUF2249 domain-containing protein n=1 Tax=Pseudactinotalea sp. HY158 TaxID=2654547 RepID=UPI00129C291C|nr:DUF2249 domain-containing protein [Pseudactinotalea sp. HY158]
MTATTLTSTGVKLLVPGAEELAASTPIEEARLRVYEVAKRPGITLMCIAFDAGVVLEDHIAKGSILIQTVTGEVVVEAAGAKTRLPLGGILHIDARVNHAVRSVTRARILVTLLQGTEADEPEVPGIMRKNQADGPDEADLIPIADVSGQADHGHGHGGCTCGEEDEALPELDVRTIPHAIRHATVFGALDGLRPGTAMILIAHHNPLPLLAQIAQRYAGAIEVAYQEEGPEVWRLRMARDR